MKIKIKTILLGLSLLICLLIMLSGCNKGATIIADDELANGFVKLEIESPALAGNLLNEPARQTLYVYLPPSYNKGDKSYPVLYFLHGYNGYPEVLLSFQEELKGVMSNGNGEFIVVALNGRNKLGGGFYVNSPVSGNWEDYVVKEVVEVIDKRFRTIAEAESRGIAGFSMGGFGAYNLGLKYPQVYQVLYSLCPGAFAEDGLFKAMPQWNQIFRQAYGTAFAPNLEKASPYADIPQLNQSEEDRDIIAKWENGYGNVKEKVEKYSKKSKKLKAIKLEYGTQDYYKWIPEGTIYLSNSLYEKGIEHEIVSFEGGHTLSNRLVRESLLPFFQEHLDF